MHDLIPRSLHEGGVDRNHWATTTHRNSSCGGNRMLFRNPYIVEAIRVRLRECVEARPSWHASGNRNDAAVIRRGSNELRCKCGGVVRLLRCGGNGDRTRLPVRIRGNTNLNFWQCRSVEGDRIRFRRPVAATLLRAHVHDHRSWHVERARKRLFHLNAVMAVQDADIGDPKVFKESPRLLRKGDDGATEALRDPNEGWSNEWNRPHDAIVPTLAFSPCTGELHLREIGRDCSHGWRD